MSDADLFEEGETANVPQRDKRPKTGGRQTKYRPDFVERARKLSEAGAIDLEICRALGIGHTAFYEYQRLYPEFADAVKMSKEVADQAVEAAFFRKATGYSFESEKIFVHDGEVIRVPIIEHIPPSDTACIFWLKNRRGWRDRTDHEIQGSVHFYIDGLEEAAASDRPLPIEGEVIKGELLEIEGPEKAL
jgi:hypothetical protein